CGYCAADRGHDSRRVAAGTASFSNSDRTFVMRIIGGRHAGLRLQPPANLPVRPTTDMGKEALFNTLQNRMDFEGIAALDLFAGTGNIAFELASRGAAHVIAVDIHFK